MTTTTTAKATAMATSTCKLSEELDRIFHRFDMNGDGKISSAELGEALRILGSTSPDEIHRMMAELDTDGDGYISYDEFAAFWRVNSDLMKDVAKIF
ncbi:hypothetical protein HPP92_004688 [Vanilla planifolia]|uniref:EF-hand domain-containing protein n=1 Tax=Vanilla planifolia TaxID=51239 RepID=A0A835RQT7_VANPL|nr:hypothetical protein HPP92_005033 [Vanilla planifolia]KAG0493694.1 hypothetical protein HPP92_004688 [Vanilla planifolia]